MDPFKWTNPAIPDPLGHRRSGGIPQGRRYRQGLPHAHRGHTASATSGGKRRGSVLAGCAKRRGGAGRTAAHRGICAAARRKVKDSAKEVGQAMNRVWMSPPLESLTSEHHKKYLS